MLIDCPPNLGFITLNGLAISDYYLIPTIPDPLSTYGIPQIISRVSEFKKIMKLKVKCLGIVATKYQSNMHLHDVTLAALPGRLRKVTSELGEEPIRIFQSFIPQSSATASAVAQAEDTSFKSKYGLSSSNGEKLHSYVTALTEEFVEYAQN